jgi:hypothetical protein
MYHPYRNGYDVLPRLSPLGDEPVFQVDECLDQYLAAKRAIAHQPYHEHDLNPLVMSTICRFMHDRLLTEHPDFKPTLDFSDIAMQIQEDLLIHQISGDDDWLAACHVCLPSHWRPEEKIGKTFQNIHAPVPGMISNKPLVRSMLKGPFYRFVWGISFRRRLNCHPDQPRDSFAGSVWVKVERQVIYGFPELGAVLFVVRPHLVEPDMPFLKKAVLGMTPEQRAYKHIPEPFVSWLIDNEFPAPRTTP